MLLETVAIYCILSLMAGCVLGSFCENTMRTLNPKLESKTLLLSTSRGCYGTSGVPKEEERLSDVVKKIKQLQGEVVRDREVKIEDFRVSAAPSITEKIIGKCYELAAEGKEKLTIPTSDFLPKDIFDDEGFRKTAETIVIDLIRSKGLRAQIWKNEFTFKYDLDIFLRY